MDPGPDGEGEGGGGGLVFWQHAPDCAWPACCLSTIQLCGHVLVLVSLPVNSTESLVPFLSTSARIITYASCSLDVPHLLVSQARTLMPDSKDVSARHLFMTFYSSSSVIRYWWHA